MKRLIVTTVALGACLLAIRATCGCEARPTTPIKPLGPSQTWVGVTDTYRTCSVHYQALRVEYVFDWNGSLETTELRASGETTGLAHNWQAEGTFDTKALAIDAYGHISEWSNPLQVTVGANHRPGVPDPISAEPLQTWYSDSFALFSRAIDPDGDSIFIKFFYDADSNLNWNSGWRGPAPSGSLVIDTVCYPHNRGVTHRLFALARERKGGRMGLISDTSAPSWVPPPGPRIGIGWRYPRTIEETPGGRWYSPAVAVLPGDELMIYTAPEGDSVFAFQDDGGSSPVVYRQCFDPSVEPSASDAPALSADRQRAYWSADNFKLYCLSAGPDMSILSRFPDDNLVAREFLSPAVYGEYLYVGRGDSMMCLRDNAGILEFVWAFDAHSEVAFPAAINSDGTRIFFACDSGYICLDNDGQEIWRAATGDNVTSAAAIDDNGIVYVGRADGRLYGYAPDDSVPVFTSQPLSEDIVGCPVIDWTGTIYTVREDASVQAYRGLGSEVAPVWNSSAVASSSVRAAPCLAPDTTIVIHDEDDDVFAVKLSDGNEKWRITLPTEKKASRRFGAGDISSSPTIGPDLYRIFVGSDNEPFFYAISVDYPSYANGLPNTPWPKYQHDLGNSGCKGGSWVY